MKLFKRIKNMYYWFKIMRMTNTLGKLRKDISTQLYYINKDKDSDDYSFTLYNRKQTPTIEIVDRYSSRKHSSNDVIDYVIKKIIDSEDEILSQLEFAITGDGYASDDIANIIIDRLVVLLDDYGGEIDIIGRYNLYGDIKFMYRFYCELDISKITLDRIR